MMYFGKSWKRIDTLYCADISFYMSFLPAFMITKTDLFQATLNPRNRERNFKSVTVFEIKIIKDYQYHNYLPSESDIKTLKEYYEIVNEARPLSEFSPHRC